MDPAELDRLGERFAALTRRYGPLFGGWGGWDHGEQYLRGLLVGGDDRRNAENLAEHVAGATPRGLQRFLSESPWPVDRVIERLQADVAPLLEAPDAVFVVDETGFRKQGKKSVGVARQYSGTLGKVENCQIGVFLGYASEHGHALVDARLYLPEVWTDDPTRCRAAGVPEEVGFATKPTLALGMLRWARARGHLQARWVTGDEVYGGNPGFRDALDGEGWWYVLDVPTSLTVCPVTGTAPMSSLEPGQWRYRDDLGRPTTVGELAAMLSAMLSAAHWHMLTIGLGAQGPRTYQFAQHRVREVRDGVIGRELTALFRRNPDGTELKLYLTNAPLGVPLLVMGQVASRRWTIETGFEQAKGETGLDEYEVRGWRGWHHHIALALLAGLFLLQLTHELGGKSARPHDPSGSPCPPPPAAAPALDPRRSPALAHADPGPQRGRLPVTRSPSAA
jgi:SRSO17 transposase